MSEAEAVVDSSGWIEVVTNGPLAEQFFPVPDAVEVLVCCLQKSFGTALHHGK